MNDAELLDAIRRSLETNRVDLYLQPVVSLPQRKVLYYEGLSRLRTDKGELIRRRDYVRVAGPAGPTSAVDNILLFRCIQVVRKLAQRNSKAGVFCNISAFSLLDSDFFPQFIEYMQRNKDLAQHLIFEFSQMTVNGAGPVEQASFEALAALGFRFSMDQVTSLKLDPKVLHDRNLRFIKVCRRRRCSTGGEWRRATSTPQRFEGTVAPQRHPVDRRRRWKRSARWSTFSISMSSSDRASCSAGGRRAKARCARTHRRFRSRRIEAESKKAGAGAQRFPPPRKILRRRSNFVDPPPRGGWAFLHWLTG